MTRTRRSLIVALTAAVVLLTGPVGAAFAAPPISNGGSTGGGSGSGTPTPVPPGGTVVPSPPAPPPIDFSVLTFSASDAQSLLHCAPTNGAGDGLLGATATLVSSATDPSATGYTNVVCVYPIPSSTVTVTCGLDIGAVFAGALDNSFATPRSITFPVVSTAFASARTPATCASSATHAWSVDTRDYGHYSLTVTSRQVMCQQQNYQNAPSVIKGCGPAYVSSASTVRLTVFCGGYSDGWTYPPGGWSADSCEGSTGSWQCRVPTPTFDGRDDSRGTAEVFASGTHHRLAWGTGPRVTGLTGVRVTRGTLGQVDGSTPTQPAWTAAPDAASAWDLQWFDRSLPGHPWIGKATWGVAGGLASRVPVGLTTNLDGTYSVASATRVLQVTGTCTGLATVKAVRAGNVN